VAGIPLPAGADYSLRAEEIKETAFRLDGLLVPGAGSQAHPLVFLEVQFQPDAAFYARWFAEIYLYLHRQQVAGEWRAVVLYPRRAVETAGAPAYRTTLENPWVHRVYLDEALPPSSRVAPGLGLIRLILARPAASAAQAKELVQNAGDERDWILDWVETILVYKLCRDSHVRIFA
jgi:predicted transposase/invertase (TIGR01784 family)